jgi:DNA-binding transcriptional regulator YiaG
MDIETPTTVPGPALADRRRGYGVTREALAAHLGLHRNTLRAWETAHSVDVLRQRRYMAALREIVDTVTGAVS